MTSNDTCGWNTGTAFRGPSRCGKPAKGSTNHPSSNNGRVCGIHIRAARSDRHRPINTVYAVRPDKLTANGCSKCGGLTFAEHLANIEVFGSPHAFVGHPIDMHKPQPTAAFSVGTLIEYDGMRVKKTHQSRHDPFPWTSEHGAEFGDEWVANALADGARVVEEE